MSLEVDVAHTQGAFRLEARFEAGDGLTALFGRSGAGKTTLIQIIAGLTRPGRGRIVADGRVLLDTARGIAIPRHRRRIGYVFQESRLFPHLSVRRNLLYGHWLTPREERREKLERVLDLLGIAPLLERRTARLSGGEKQRVAIGRALLASPRLLLMDEPLTGLDDARKAEILPYLERLRDEARIPIVYVSHSVAEVTRLATSLVLLEEGRIAAQGAAREVMGRLDLFPLFGASEAGAILATRVLGHDVEFGLTRLGTRAGELRVPRLDRAAGSSLSLRIRARDVMIATRKPEGLSALNVLPGRIADMRFEDGAIVELALDLGGERLLARITRRAAENLGLAPGLKIYAVIKSITLEGDAPAGAEHGAI